MELRSTFTVKTACCFVENWCNNYHYLLHPAKIVKVHIEQEMCFYDSTSIFPYNTMTICTYTRCVWEWYGNRRYISRTGDTNPFFQTYCCVSTIMVFLSAGVTLVCVTICQFTVYKNYVPVERIRYKYSLEYVTNRKMSEKKKWNYKIRQDF